MDTALMVNALHQKGCHFILTRNFKDIEKTQKAVRKHHQEAKKGRHRKLIIMAIQNEALLDYTILVTAKFPNEKELEKYGFFPVKKDRANWIPIQYRNRKGKEHLNSREFDTRHTTNNIYMDIKEVHQYLNLAEKAEQIQLIYK